MNKLNRRDFLRLTATTIAVSAVSAIPSIELPPAVSVAELSASQTFFDMGKAMMDGFAAGLNFRNEMIAARSWGLSPDEWFDLPESSRIEIVVFEQAKERMTRYELGL